MNVLCKNTQKQWPTYPYSSLQDHFYVATRKLLTEGHPGPEDTKFKPIKYVDRGCTLHFQFDSDYQLDQVTEDPVGVLLEALKPFTHRKWFQWTYEGTDPSITVTFDNVYQADAALSQFSRSSLLGEVRNAVQGVSKVRDARDTHARYLVKLGKLLTGVCMRKD